MDQHTLTTVLTGLGVLVAMASYHRAEKKDRAAQTEKLEHRLEKNLGARIDGVQQNLDARSGELAERIDTLDTKIDGVEQRLSARIDDLDTKIDGVELRLTTRIDGLDGRANSLDRNFGSLSARFDSLDGRFDSLEARMDAGFAESRAEHRDDMRDVRQYLHSLEERFYQFLVPRRPVAAGTDDG